MPEEDGLDFEQANEDFEQKRYDAYLTERSQLIDAARESARTFDKAVLTFGAAVFGFSIAFLKDIAPHPAHETLKWLGAAWFLFALGLLLILLSFLFSHQACDFQIECITRKQDNPGDNTRNHWSLITDICNYSCIAVLFLGLLSWSIFAFDNLRVKENAAMNESQEPALKKGYVPLAAPARAPQPQQPASPAPQPVEKK